MGRKKRAGRSIRERLGNVIDDKFEEAEEQIQEHTEENKEIEATEVGNVMHVLICAIILNIPSGRNTY